MTLTATQPTCDARATGRVVTDWGFKSLPCNATRGLRQFVDYSGTTRYACPAAGHMNDVVRRFGRMSDPEMAEPCRFCHRLAPILNGTYQRMTFGGAISLVCDDCASKADEPQDDPDA